MKLFHTKILCKTSERSIFVRIFVFYSIFEEWCSITPFFKMFWVSLPMQNFIMTNPRKRCHISPWNETPMEIGVINILLEVMLTLLTHFTFKQKCISLVKLGLRFFESNCQSVGHCIFHFTDSCVTQLECPCLGGEDETFSETVISNVLWGLHP